MRWDFKFPHRLAFKGKKKKNNIDTKITKL